MPVVVFATSNLALDGVLEVALDEIGRHRLILHQGARVTSERHDQRLNDEHNVVICLRTIHDHR